MMRRALLAALLLSLGTLSCSSNDDPVAVDLRGGSSSSKTGLEAERPEGAVNVLEGAPLEEHYFVWFYSYFLHPFGPWLLDWWDYASIPDVLAAVRFASEANDFPDRFTRYLDSVQAHSYRGEYEERTDTTVFVERPADSVALIQVTEFRQHSVGAENGDTSGTWSEFREALRATEDAKATILDLRGNPGGTVSICNGVADEILGAVPFYIVWSGWSRLTDQVPEFTRVDGSAGGLGEGRNWVFLQDGGSASCSELVLTAVRTAPGSGPTVGERSYGKGIGQQLIDTPSGGIFSVTALVVYGMDSASYHGTGIEPDVAVSGEEAQLDSAVALARASFAPDSASPAPAAASGSVLPPPPRGGLEALSRRIAGRRSAAEPEMVAGWRRD